MRGEDLLPARSVRAGNMIQLTKRHRLTIGAIATLAYFIVAYWFKISYVPMALNAREPDVAGAKFMLQRPFFRDFLDSEFAAISDDYLFSAVADTSDDTTRSTIMIYEDGKPLGPAHSSHADVGNIGLGRFSHWHYTSTMFLFSSSDNTNPRTNGRTYWAVKSALSQREATR